MDTNVRAIRRELEAVTLAPAEAVGRLVPIAHMAPVRATRIEAYRLLGDVAGRAFDAPWDVAEKAAWALLELTRHADATAERCGLVRAMGRGFRNLWLMPFIHARLGDENLDVAEAAIGAAGGLGFAGLEEAVTSRFLGGDAPLRLRRAAIATLGRMGAVSAADRLVTLVGGPHAEAAAALTALTEIRSPAGVNAAVALLDREPVPEVLIAATRYLAELGQLEVLPTLRRLARDEDAELRLVAELASRALKAERARDAGERILVALTERDRAVRAVLARRLRTLPVADVLEQAQMLLPDDPEGVVQILAEVRTAEVTRFLLALSKKTELPVQVRARAVGSIEANEGWEREALAQIIREPGDERIRAAAAQTMGAFASLEELFLHIGPLADDPSPLLRGALLWALQLAARPASLASATSTAERAQCEKLLRRAFADADPTVRRRAAYVAGNLDLTQLAPDLIAMVKAEDEHPELRVAAFVGLGELAASATLDAMIGLFKSEEDPQVLAVASRAIAATILARTEATIDLSRIQGKVAHLLKSDDARVRAAAVRLAGLAGGGVPAKALLASAEDPAPAVREEALTALGRLAATEAEPILLEAMDDADPAIHERAADALLALGGRKPLERLLRFVAGEDDEAVRARVAAHIALPRTESAHFMPLINSALGKLRSDDATYDALLGLKVKLLEEEAGGDGGGGAVDAAILAAFPTWARLSKVRGFEPLGRSLRTAESLYRTTTSIADADFSPPIMLWMKCMEGYVHAWLSPQLLNLQRDFMMLCDHVDHLMASWPPYQSYLARQWPDPVEVGGTKVEIPLRSQSNALREYQDRRTKRLDGTLSVTEWSRLMLFFAVDHPSGVRNVFKVSSKSSDQVVRLAHRLQTLAAVRNVCTHRAAVGPSTLEAFRKAYYAAFEELTKLA